MARGPSSLHGRRTWVTTSPQQGKYVTDRTVCSLSVSFKQILYSAPVISCVRHHQKQSITMIHNWYCWYDIKI